MIASCAFRVERGIPAGGGGVDAGMALKGAVLGDWIGGDQGNDRAIARGEGAAGGAQIIGTTPPCDGGKSKRVAGEKRGRTPDKASKRSVGT